ncbi:MAG: hypothetical protein HY696_06565 [Deltaproteobacteria bacterium]|nr:hypothetical protein [Deltaproteobacteria bacterium]
MVKLNWYIVMGCFSVLLCSAGVEASVQEVADDEVLAAEGSAADESAETLEGELLEGDELLLQADRPGLPLRLYQPAHPRDEFRSLPDLVPLDPTDMKEDPGLDESEAS